MFCFYKLKHARRKLRIMALKEQMRNDVIKILVKPVSWCGLWTNLPIFSVAVDLWKQLSDKKVTTLC